MAVEILTTDQVAVLKALSQQADLAKNLYLTGGTPLAAFYLHHRYSEDLDFFSEEEIDVPSIQAFWQKLKNPLGIKKIDFQQSFNRNLFFIELPDGVLKTEFTYFPFPRIEPSTPRQYGIAVDGPLDIAVNKLFTIYSRTKARDYIDLYLLCQQYGFTIDQLAKLARQKFDTQIDPMQLGTQFVNARQAEDAPCMIVELAPETWQHFFKIEAERLKDQILDQNDEKR